MAEYYLRELEPEDAVAINEWRNDPDVIINLGAPFRYISKVVDDKWLTLYFGNRANCVRLAICSSAGSKMIGAVYLLNIDWLARNCEFAIWIGDKGAQGLGAGKYATEKTLEHAFSDLNLNSVYLTVLKTNERAASLYKKIGFQIEGVRRQAVFKNGSYSDLIMMSILKTEFQSDQPLSG
ncbi:MAG: GNAT family N-acetyltransferase [Marinobacter sp.]|uniref:GNAT family N-acetyltransferase n=1 Tax=Marinobacter sp. TaxID=50741 RepID=UPI001B52ECD4|nr:GNAT family protein [Marinobacter sp.]MBQ0746656.1 GNAT family N-acetyltransferase [Marinobacter sp.]MBQ0814219.1 GNAT family N-acetyltransferase [Marinobacter sp.]